MRKNKIITMILVIAMLVVIAPTQKVKAETTNFSMEWTGTASPKAAAGVSIDKFNSRRRVTCGFTATGTPTWGTAFKIGAVARNCTYKVGGNYVGLVVDGGNLGTYLLFDMTPAASYDGETVKFGLSISGASDSVFYVRGDIGN